ncbi:uncharacterized protein LOC134222438 [Armigeres subalbatus]|uniref:uncharacterized protein LOC134222438 n=1 Tax=Armigeres subalbatus TaxID=124917 RepID=UPI002ED1C9FA
MLCLPFAMTLRPKALERICRQLWTETRQINCCMWFVAGAKNNGFPKPPALAVQSSRLLDKPYAILVSVFAFSGATSFRSAHLPSSMCRTESPHPPQLLHSSAPRCMWTSSGMSEAKKKCSAWWTGKSQLGELLLGHQIVLHTAPSCQKAELSSSDRKQRM